MAKLAIQAFFKETLKEDPPMDEDVMSYLESCLSEQDDALETLSDLLTAYSAAFAAMDEGQRAVLLLDLHQQVQEGPDAKAVKPPVPAHTAPPPEELPQQPRSPSANQHQQAESPASASTSHRQSEEEEELDSAALDQLMELCVGRVSRDYLRHIMQRTGSLQAAADQVLEAGEQLQAQEAAWLAPAVAAATGEEEYAHYTTDKQFKQRVLAKYDLLKVDDLPQGSKKQQQKQLQAVQLNCWSAPKAGGSSSSSKAVRYRDGQAVSTKGEKYIIEAPQEYDGGSKGKVYTKGKRGKGFV